MKKGVLISNSFLRTHKFVEHYEWLKEAATKHGVELELLENSQILCDTQDAFDWVKEFDFVLFWDKDVMLGDLLTQYARKYNVPVYNSIEAIALCDNKWNTYLELLKWNNTHPASQKIPLMETIAAPMTYSNVGYTTLDFVDQVIHRLGLPMVIKECYGSFGMQVYLANSKENVLQLTRKLAGTPFIYQKFLQKSSGKDVRVEVVGDEVVASMYRYSVDGDFRANITNGGHMKEYEPSDVEKDLALRVVKALHLDFAGVDLLFDENMAGIVCEVNSNAHFKNIHTCTGVNVADCIMDYIVSQGENRE